jgi:hypothetical protein
MGATAPQTAPAITLADVKRAANACAKASQARKDAEAADSEKLVAMMEIFEPLLGIRTEAELRSLPPDQLRRTANARINSGVVNVRGLSSEMLLKQAIQLSQSPRRNVSWRDCYLADCGEARAQEKLNDTPESYSYKIVAPPDNSMICRSRQTMGTRVLQKR